MAPLGSTSMLPLDRVFPAFGRPAISAD